MRTREIEVTDLVNAAIHKHQHIDEDCWYCCAAPHDGGPGEDMHTTCDEDRMARRGGTCDCGAEQANDALAILVERLETAERMQGHGFLVREWRDKAEEYRVERDAARTGADKAQAALLHVAEELSECSRASKTKDPHIEDALGVILAALPAATVSVWCARCHHNRHLHTPACYGVEVTDTENQSSRPCRCVRFVPLARPQEVVTEE